MPAASRKIDLKSLAISLAPIAFAMVLDALDAFQGWMGIDNAQEISLTILIITAALWITEAVPLFATSFIVIFLQVTWLLPAVNAGSPREARIGHEVFLSPFFSDIILLFLGGFTLSAALHKYGMDQRIAGWILKKTGSKPTRVLIGIIAVSAALSMWMSNTATAAMMLAIALPIIARIPDANPFSKALVLAIPFACNLGGLGTPIGTPPNAIAMTYLAEGGIQVTFAEWMLATLPFLLLFLAFLWWLLLRFYPPGDLVLAIEMEETGKLDARHYIVIAVFLATCLGWLTSGIHPLSTGTVGLIPIIVFFAFKYLSKEDFRNLSWDVLFMLGGGLCLGEGLKASGLTSALIDLIPADAGTAFILFALLATVMTTFMSNTATANLVIPIAVSMGSEAPALAVTIAMMCSTAMALPVCTPPNAIAFGSGLLKAKEMIRPGLVITLIGVITVLLLAPAYWKLTGLFG